MVVTVESAGWEYTSLTVLHLAVGQSWNGSTGNDEIGLVTLGGTCTVDALGQSWRFGGRKNVFDGPPWALYLPIGTDYSVRADTELELAICGTRAEQSFPPLLITPPSMNTRGN